MKVLLKAMIALMVIAFGYGFSQAATITQTYVTDFTGAPFTEGGFLSSSGDWNAQNAWTTTDVGSDGYALVSTSFSRAINNGGTFMMAVGDSVTMSMNLNILGDWNEAGGNNDLLSFGLTEVNDSGTALVRVGAGIRANTFADTLNLRDQVFSGSPNVAALDWADINDTSSTVSDNLAWSVTITKSATLNEFLVSTSISDTEGANQGSGSLDFTIVSSDLYSAGSLYPILRGGNSLPGSGITGVQVDSLVAGTTPEPASLSLFGMGALVIFSMRRKKKIQ